MPRRELDAWLWLQSHELLAQAERIQQRLLASVQAVAPGGPDPVGPIPLNLFEGADQLTLMAAVPGVGPGGVQVTLDEGALVLRAHRSLPSACKVGALRLLEIPCGRFERRLRLPPGLVLDQVTLQDGMLLITLRKGP